LRDYEWQDAGFNASSMPPLQPIDFKQLYNSPAGKISNKTVAICNAPLQLAALSQVKSE
jgi:hypothetical protein